MRGSDGSLYFSEKDCMKSNMNEENDWDYYVEGGAVEGPVACVVLVVGVTAGA